MSFTALSNFKTKNVFYWSCNGCRGCSTCTIPFSLLSVAHNFDVVCSLIWGCLLINCGGRCWNFGGQFVAKLESKIDAESGVEQMLKNESLRLSEFPGLVARRRVRGR